MEFVEEFERLGNLIKEINNLCENVEAETREIQKQTEEAKEYNYMMFCTELAPYWELAKGLDRAIQVDTGIPNYTLCLSEQIYIYYKNYSFVCLIYRKSFFAYDNYRDGHQNTVDEIVREIDWNVFKKSFAEEVEKTLTIRAKLANENLEYTKKQLKEVQ